MPDSRERNFHTLVVLRGNFNAQVRSAFLVGPSLQFPFLVRMINDDESFALAFPGSKQFKQLFGHGTASCQAIIAIKEYDVIFRQNGIKPCLPIRGIQVDFT